MVSLLANRSVFSPAWPVVMATVADSRLVSSGSLTVMVLVMMGRASCREKASAALSMAASTGASFTAVMVMLRVWVLELSVPSLTVKDTVRVAVLGLSLLLW